MERVSLPKILHSKLGFYLNANIFFDIFYEIFFVMITEQKKKKNCRALFKFT